MRVPKNFFPPIRHVLATLVASMLVFIAGVAAAQDLADDQDAHL